MTQATQQRMTTLAAESAEASAHSSALSNPAHPQGDHVDEVFDVVVIGGGPAGENAAQYAVQGTDMTAAIIEGEKMGGECSYYACMPSKALLRPLEVANTARHLPGLTGAEIDRDALLARRDDWVSHYDDAGQVKWAESVDLAVIRGWAQIIGERLLAVDGPDGRTIIEARKAVIIATGSRPSIPAVLQNVEPWDSRDVTAVTEVPERLVIVGGGVVACEAATWMTALGSDVTMLVRGAELLKGQEPFASEIVLDALTKLGVRVLTNTQAKSATRKDVETTPELGKLHGGTVHIELDGDSIDADEILVATGRKPLLETLNLESIGLTPEDILHENMPEWLYAVGDANGKALLTHMGKYQARVIGERIADIAAGRTPDETPEFVPVPHVIFTDPQVASTGFTEAAARKSGIDVVTTEVPYTAAAGASLLRDGVQGRAKLVINRATNAIVGATFVGPEAGELIHSATIAIIGEVPIERLRHAVPSYPTASEIWLRLIEALPQEVLRPHRA